MGLGIAMATWLPQPPAPHPNPIVSWLFQTDQPVLSFALYIPEKLDTMQEQYSASDFRQQIVQGILESALLHPGISL